jgi:hypothetical protein
LVFVAEWSDKSFFSTIGEIPCWEFIIIRKIVTLAGNNYVWDLVLYPDLSETSRTVLFKQIFGSAYQFTNVSLTWSQCARASLKIILSHKLRGKKKYSRCLLRHLSIDGTIPTSLMKIVSWIVCVSAEGTITRSNDDELFFVLQKKTRPY